MSSLRDYAYRYPALPANPSVEHRARSGQRLTSTEREIVQLLADGAHDGEIARSLDMTVRNYRRHLTAALIKLGARTRAHAVAISIRDGEGTQP